MTLPSDGEPWLVVIDMQHIFRDPSSEWAAPEYAAASAGIRALLPRFGDRVVFTRFVAPAVPQGAWVEYYEQAAFALVDDEDPLYAITDEFLPSGPVVTVPTFGKWGPQLAAATNGSTHLVLTGVATDCCVLSTALAAADAGVRVTVVDDACAGSSSAAHRQAIDAMALYTPLIRITTVAESLAAEE